MATFPVVLDACVLYPAALRDTLLGAAVMGLYRVHWSQAILDETVRNLIADGRMTPDGAQRLVGSMAAFFEAAMVVVPPSQIDAMPTHPKDRHVAATAVVADAKVIVTANVGDFPSAGLEPWGIGAQHPDTFLCHQYWLHPEAMAEVVRRQQQKLRNPAQPLEYVLGSVALHVPPFVSLIRPALLP